MNLFLKLDFNHPEIAYGELRLENNNTIVLRKHE